jgi:chemotaxis protein methyltransferase CheR
MDNVFEYNDEIRNNLNGGNPLEDRYFTMIKEWVITHLKFNSQHYNESYLKRRIQSRMFYFKYKSYKEYLNLIKSNVDEQRQLIKHLTVNITRFFRNKVLFTEIENKIIPDFFKITPNLPRTIKVWSAGCSSGEEPYSVAIIGEELKKKGYNVKLQIIATDIDTDSIASAKKGIYTLQQLSECDQKIIDKYFTKLDDKKYQLNPEIMKNVSFRMHDLFHDEFYRQMDIIMCRNVVIYFNNEAKQTLYNKFYDSLSKGGFFILGKSETLTGETRYKFEFFNSNEKVFKK